MKKISRLIERGIIYILILLMSVILILATIELAHYVIRSILNSDYLLVDLDELMDLFGVFLMVLIGIELLDTIKVYLRENQVHVEVIVLVAIIALARKIVVIKIEELSGETIIGLGVLILALSAAYFFIKKAGLMVYQFTDEKPVIEQKPPQKTNTL